MINPILTNHPLWVNHLKERKKVWNRWAWFVFPAFIVVLLGIGIGVKPASRASNWNSLFLLFSSAFILLGSRLNMWATKLSIKSVDRIRARDMISKLVTTPTNLKQADWDMNALESSLDRELARNFESGKAITYSLLIEGVDGKQILEPALRHEHRNVSSIILEHMMDNVKIGFQFVPMALIAALIFSAVAVAWMERIAKVQDPLFPWLVGFFVLTTITFCISALRGKNPDNFVNPLKFMLTLIALLITAFYGRPGMERIKQGFESASTVPMTKVLPDSKIH